MEQFVLPLAPERHTYSVSELNQAIREAFDREFFDVWVAGEISGCKLSTAGHHYFTLKDATSQVSCVSFRSAHRFFKVKPKDGLAVLARGRLDVYEIRGSYQLVVELLEPQGYGALQLAFEELKKKLDKEGFFDPARKRKLPRFPSKIGIVTSARGAVISDMVSILARRFPGLHIRVFPALVQGDGSVEEVCRGIDYFSKSQWPDVTIVARGGGSLEDLWTFNEEAVARAIFRSSVPVVSAIGHETDVTIADFVADLRAPTPSAAAELVVCQKEDVQAQIDAMRAKAAQALRYKTLMLSRRLHQQGIDRAEAMVQRSLMRGHQRVDDCAFRFRERIRAVIEDRRRRVRDLEQIARSHDPRPYLARRRQRRESLNAAAIQAVRMQIARRRNRLENATTKLHQLSPLAVLNRGYAIVTDSTGHALRSAAETREGASVEIRLAKGRLGASVTSRETE